MRDLPRLIPAPAGLLGRLTVREMVEEKISPAGLSGVRFRICILSPLGGQRGYVVRVAQYVPRTRVPGAWLALRALLGYEGNCCRGAAKVATYIMGASCADS